ncbi:MAG TPA: ATP-binding protein [Kofleriaceae bacterium]|jgi:signal transduction histidine kinase|nr:ATP-binding protein [Kofleriaceae bacterium]
MGSATALVELGDRYWALGLPAAAKSALVRALAQTDDPEPALRLADLALAQGDAASARSFATEAAKRAPGPATKILLGRAQLAAGELAAARMSFGAALDAPKATAWDRARAHLELSRAAAAQGDPSGAAAQAGAAFEAAITAASQAVSAASLTLLEEIAAALISHGRQADAMASLETARDSLGRRMCAAALLAARHAAGDATVGEAELDAALATIEEEGGATSGITLRRLERRTRKPSTAEREALLGELDALIHASAGEDLPAIDRARMWFLYGALCADDLATRDRAEEAYRKGLAFQPGHTAAACRLALLVLDRGDQAGALAEIERALRIDASHGMAWRNAARMLDAQSPSLGVIVGRLLDAANPGAGSAAGSVAPRLVTATAEVVRHDVIAGVYAHGHRVKNLLGIIGARTRSARKLAAEGDVHDRLKDLEADVTALYEEWAQYLRSMQAPTPTVERVPLPPLLHEVVLAAQARIQHVPIAVDTAAALPDVHGDRMLLREALLNIVSNAAEACASLTSAPPSGGAARAGEAGTCGSGGEVAVRVRAVAAPGASTAPLVEIVVADTGPGIARAHLGRLFVPGFTTKETGSGVGLAIAERVVSAHHGRITLESEEGRGTTITITLPTDKSSLASLPMWASERGAP